MVLIFDIAVSIRRLSPFVLGAILIALLFREFKSRTGSAPIVRFILGMLAMTGALAFWDCPWRALLRLGAFNNPNRHRSCPPVSPGDKMSNPEYAVMLVYTTSHALKAEKLLA